MRPAAIDFEDDLGGRLFPDEWLRSSMIVLDVIVDSGYQFRNTVEGASTYALRGDLSQPALHKVQPRR